MRDILSIEFLGQHVELVGSVGPVLIAKTVVRPYVLCEMHEKLIVTYGFITQPS